MPCLGPRRNQETAALDSTVQQFHPDETTKDKSSNSPHVDDVSLASPVLVVVEDDVTVASVKLSVRGRIHGHFVRSLNTPNLDRNKQANP